MLRPMPLRKRPRNNVFLATAYVICCTALSAPPPNVVLLSVDTLRADFLGCYGCPYPASPHLDRLAAESLVFEDCTCEVPLTAPSMASMFTSRFPRMTGVTRNGLRLRDDVPAITTVFRDAGYFTLCVQSNWTLKARLSGLDRGFDVYEDGFREKRWGIMKAERAADDVTDVALDLLRQRPAGKPFFAWVHYSDPHAPYEFHKQYAPAGRPRFFMRNQEKVRRKYASEVAFTDAQIARLLEALPLENTAIVFVADHGESLYEHDYLGHGRRIYRHEMRIPFMVRAMGVPPGRSNAPVRGIDAGATLLGLAGLQPAPGMLGTDVLAAPPPPTRVRVFETYGGAVPKLPGARALMAEAPPQFQGATAEGWKLILGNSKAELFYLPDDPGELADLAAREPQRVRDLKELIVRWDDETSRAAGEGAELGVEDMQALEALGYVE